MEIAILGAGIGGLTTAIALRKNGFSNIRIYERRQNASTIGAGIVLWANAGKILSKLNVFDEVAKAGGSINQMQRWSKEGEFLGAISVRTIDSNIGAKSVSISRHDFQEILIQKVKELEIPIFYNHNALKISTKKNTTVLDFTNGMETTAAIVVGADGRMNSICRKYVNEDNSPVYQNFVNWIGFVESDTPIFNENKILDFWGCGERFGIVPINKYKGYWAGGKALPVNSIVKNENHKTYLLKQFKDWPDEISRVIEITKQEGIKFIEVHDHEPIQRWHKNNVCLLGDAAHAALPTSGQGACQAIEDAWFFATLLKKHHNPEQAFLAFRNTRLDKTTQIIMTGRRLAQSIFNEDLEYCEQRNLQAKSTDYKESAERIAELWA